MPGNVTRRVVLKGLGGSATAILAHSALFAHSAADPGGVALYDEAIAASRVIATEMDDRSRLIALDGDRLHFWRELYATSPARISGCTHWSDLVLIRGLAAEAGLHMRNVRQHPIATGRAVFSWTLTSRSVA